DGSVLTGSNEDHIVGSRNPQGLSERERDEHVIEIELHSGKPPQIDAAIARSIEGQERQRILDHARRADRPCVRFAEELKYHTPGADDRNAGRVDEAAGKSSLEIGERA